MSRPGEGDVDDGFSAKTWTKIPKTMRRIFISIFLSLYLIGFLSVPVEALPQRVGYGPKFDACGDNCQTALLHFCTQLRDAQQQLDCWCGNDALVKRQFTDKMEACLATCDPAVSNRTVQRDMILRYKAVTCKGSAKEDTEFEKYYEERYGVTGFSPQATAAAPPALPVSTVRRANSTTTARSNSSAATRTTAGSTSTSVTSSRSLSITITTIVPTQMVSSSSTASMSSPTSSYSTYHGSSRPDTASGVSLTVSEITGIVLGGTIALGILSIAIILLRRRRQRRHHRSYPITEKPNPSNNDYVWSPITSNPPAPPRNFKKTVYDFLKWKPIPSGLNINPSQFPIGHVNHSRASSSSSSTPLASGSSSAPQPITTGAQGPTNLGALLPAIRVQSPAGGRGPRRQISPPQMLMSQSSHTYRFHADTMPVPPTPGPPPQQPLPIPPGPPDPRYVSPTSSRSSPLSEQIRHDFILPPVPSTHIVSQHQHQQLHPQGGYIYPGSPHAITTPSGMPPAPFGFNIGNHPTAAPSNHHSSVRDSGALTEMNMGYSPGGYCSQDEEDDEKETGEIGYGSDWADYATTEGTATLERRAQLDGLFEVVEAEYGSGIGGEGNPTVRLVPVSRSDTGGTGRTGRSVRSAWSSKRGRRLV